MGSGSVACTNFFRFKWVTHGGVSHTWLSESHMEGWVTHGVTHGGVSHTWRGGSHMEGWVTQGVTHGGVSHTWLGLAEPMVFQRNHQIHGHIRYTVHIYGTGQPYTWWVFAPCTHLFLSYSSLTFTRVRRVPSIVWPALASLAMGTTTQLSCCSTCTHTHVHTQ